MELFNTKNGRVFKCKNCKAIHIEYKNLNFNFNKKQYDHFRNYIAELNGELWEYKNQTSLYRKKIVIPIGHKNFNVLLNKEELNELKDLLQEIKTDGEIVKMELLGIDFNCYLN